MKILSRQPTFPIGIDIGSRTIKAVQLGGPTDAPRLTAATIVDRPTIGDPLGADEAANLRGVLRSAGFEGNHIVVAAPSDDLLTAFLELPPRETGVPLDQIAKMEFARLHRCDPQSIEVSFWDLPTPARANPTTQVMAAGCRHQDSDQLLDVLESSGFYVRAIDTHAWSVLRACAPLLATEGMTMILDLGYTSAKLILANNRVVTYERNLTDAGIDSLIGSAAKDLDLDRPAIEKLIQHTALTAESSDKTAGNEKSATAQRILNEHYRTIADELKVSMSYAAHRYRDAELAGMLLIGGGAQVPDLAGFFNQALDLNVQTVMVRDITTCGEQPAADTTLAVAATGLAKFTEK